MALKVVQGLSVRYSIKLYPHRHLENIGKTEMNQRIKVIYRDVYIRNIYLKGPKIMYVGSRGVPVWIGLEHKHSSLWAFDSLHNFDHVVLVGVQVL